MAEDLPRQLADVLRRAREGVDRLVGPLDLAGVFLGGPGLLLHARVDLRGRGGHLERGVTQALDHLVELPDHGAKGVVEIARALELQAQVPGGDRSRGLDQLLQHVEHGVEVVHERADLVVARGRDAGQSLELSTLGHAP